jgi:PAS domain S-box-containing protein
MQRWYNTKFINLINALLALAFIVVVGSFSLTYVQMQRWAEANAWVLHTHTVIETTTLALVNITKTETNLYDYIYQPDPSTLQQMQANMRLTLDNITQLNKLTKDNVMQQKSLREIERFVSEYQAAVNNSLQIFTQQGKDAALDNKLRFELRQDIANISQLINAINSYEESLLQLRNLNLSSRGHLVNVVIGWTAFIGIISLLLCSLLLNYYIYKRTQAENMQKKLEYRFQKIMDGSRDFIAAVDKDEKFIAFNSAYKKLFKQLFNNDIYPGMTLKQAFAHYHKNQEAIENWQRALHGEEFLIVNHFEDNKKAQHYLEATFSNIKENDKLVGAAHIMRDVTERYKVDKLKNEFISVVSHELRTPLTSVKGSIGLLLGGAMGKFEPKVIEMLNIANNNCERLVNLINDILDVEKIESGKAEFKLAPINVYELLYDAVHANHAFAEKFKVDVKLVATDSGVAVLADYNRLMQVLNNLISNAIKFSEPGSAIEVLYAVYNDIVRISVTDHGKGIDKEFQPHLFERFTQGDSSDNRSHAGSGLGLNISKTIIDKLGGKINFISEENMGSTFYVELPVHLMNFKETNALKVPSTPVEVKDEEIRIDGRKPIILHIEDDVDLSEIIRNVLLKHMQVVTVPNKEKAQAMLGKNKFDLILLDLALPDGSGEGLLPLLKMYNVPVVVFSAYEVPDKYLPYVTEMLIKSKTTNKKLLDTITKVLRSNTAAAVATEK